MKVKSRKHVYRFVPDYTVMVDGKKVSNRQLPKEEQIVALIESISLDEDDAFQREMIIASKKFSPDKYQELSEKRQKDLVEKKFHGIEGLEVEGYTGSLETWDACYEHAPREIMGQIMAAMRSTEMLSAGEQKNF
jgi:hypothetical protein